MSIDPSGQKSRYRRRVAMAIAASGIMVASTVQARSSNIVVVPPADLPALAQQPGDAMFFREADDGITTLYVEQNHGAQLAVFDVTDPRHVKSKGSVQLRTPGSFDFVSPLGGQKHLVRFRQYQAEGILDFHKAWLPSLEPLPGFDSSDRVLFPGADGFKVSDQGTTVPRASDPPPMQDYQVIDTSSTRYPAPVYEVKHVRQELTKQDTGTTFLLTEAGLYLIRRPTAESDKRRREEVWFWQHTGG